MVPDMVSLEQCAGNPYLGVHTSIMEVDMFSSNYLWEFVFYLQVLHETLMKNGCNLPSTHTLDLELGFKTTPVGGSPSSRY